MFEATPTKADKNRCIGRMQSRKSIIFLDQDSLSSTNDHSTDFDETPSTLSGQMPLGDLKWILTTPKLGEATLLLWALVR